MYIKVNVPAIDLQILWIPLLDKMDCKCQRVFRIIIFVALFEVTYGMSIKDCFSVLDEMRVIQMLRDFLPHKEASATTCKSGVVMEMPQRLQRNTSTRSTFWHEM